MKNSDIQKIYSESREKKWTYPQLFDALKAVGVERYEVDVLKYEIKYVGGKTSVTHPAPTGFKPLTLGKFDLAAFKTALTRAQKQESSYPEFLQEIAASGIKWYRVDMGPRLVSYYGQDKRNKIVEPVPPTHV